MRHSTRALTRFTGVALAVGAVAAPTALAAPNDLRSPDASDVGSASSTQVDLRSPDATDSGSVPAAVEPQSIVAGGHSSPLVARTAPQVRATANANSSDWGDAAIGAGVVVVLAGFGGLVALRRRPATRQPSRTSPVTG